jgi:hypothetical protein
MVSAGLGIGLMPAMAMQHSTKTFGGEGDGLLRRTIALRSSSHSLSPAAAAFIEIVRDTARRSGQLNTAPATGKAKRSGRDTIGKRAPEAKQPAPAI